MTLTLAPNSEMLGKDKTAKLEWTLEVGDDETIQHRFTSKPFDMVNTLGTEPHNESSTYDEEWTVGAGNWRA